MRDAARHASSPWPATPLIAAITFLGIYGLTVMIETGPWMRTTAFVLIATSVGVIITRLASRSRVLPTVVGALVAIVVMVPLFARDEEGQRILFPTPAGLRGLGAALRDGVAYAEVTVAPAPEDLGFTALITASAVALFLVAEHLAVSWRLGATSGLLLLIPWMPAVIFQHRVSTTILLVCIGLWLLSLALVRRSTAGEDRPAAGGAIAATTATVAAVLVVAPTALGGIGWGMIPRIEAPESFDTATRLNLALDLRTSLTTNSNNPVLVYSSTGDRPEAFRLYTLTDFDGVRWSRDELEVPAFPATSGLLWPEPVDDWTSAPRERIEMQVLNLAERNLPVPPTPRTLEVEEGWFYDAERDEVVGDNKTARDARYSIVTDTTYHQRDSLEAAQSEIDAGNDMTDPRVLAIPPATDAARVTTLSRQVTSEAENRFQQALALQTFLRDTSRFTYDTSVDPSGGDAMSTFLDDQTGYCVQFATAMVLMARSLDIPARLAVGFLPGDATDQGTYVIQGGDAHAWPELWFPGEGWVRFEPTPAVQTGLPPEYADPYAGQVPVRPEVLDPDTANDPSQRPDELLDPDLDTTALEETEPAPTVPVWAIVAIGIVLIAVMAAATTWWRRRAGAHRARGHGPEAEWEAMREQLPEMLQWSRTLTPHEATEWVEEGMRRLGPGLTGSAREALGRLSHAVADHRYAPNGTAISDGQLREWADAVVTEATEAEERYRADARV